MRAPQGPSPHDVQVTTLLGLVCVVAISFLGPFWGAVVVLALLVVALLFPNQEG